MLLDAQEWDALMLEMHQIRQALSTARQELSFSLYMQDAATRVIARHVWFFSICSLIA